MKVILHSDIGKIGKKNDVVDVADGYGRNYLIPRGLADLATEAKIAVHEREREAREQAETERVEVLTAKLSELTEEGIAITAPANEQGHLFAGVHANKIAAKIGEAAGVNVPGESVKMDDMIKETGTFDIDVRAGDKSVTVPVTIQAE